MLPYAWLIVALPLAAFVVIVFGTLRQPRLSGLICIGSIFLAWLMALGVVREVAAGGRLEVTTTWFEAGPAELPIGFLVDPLAAVMLIVVTTVSLLVQIYAQGYMHGDPGYARFYAFMSLFTASMLGLVLANNFLWLYMFWELVGLCSYLLIGFWYSRPAAAAAAVKAFVVTRLGDFGFMVGIALLWTQTGSLVLTEIQHQVEVGALGGTILTVAMLLVFCGAVGKSAQFPLHVWLPDAMEGPTPVSALIHAATMVVAGIYLVARTLPLFEHAPAAMLVVAYIGIFTALLAATMGLVMTDIKRVIAYSTISSLGYMMAALGMGSLNGGMFYLFNHGFFKALLFLGAGSVIHAVHSNELPEMGGLGRRMPITAVTFLFGALAMAGVPPFSGFFAKDEILATARHFDKYLLFPGDIYAVAMVTAGLTGIYIFRAFFLAFWGEPRYRAAHAHGAQFSPAEPHESPPVMTIPLILLAIPALLSGFLGSPWLNNPFGHFLHPEEAAAALDWAVAGPSIGVVLAGIFVAWAVYGAGWLSPQAVGRAFRPIYLALYNKYGLDDLYGWLVRRVVLGLSYAALWFDLVVIDGIVNGVGWVTAQAGALLRRVQTGRLPNYGLAIYAGVVIIVTLMAFAPR